MHQTLPLIIIPCRRRITSRHCSGIVFLPLDHVTKLHPWRAVGATTLAEDERNFHDVSSATQDDFLSADATLRIEHAERGGREDLNSFCREVAGEVHRRHTGCGSRTSRQ